MRKRYCMGLVLVLVMAAALACLHYMKLNTVVLQADGGVPYVDVNLQQSTNRVKLWQDGGDGKSYFFLPSCVRHHKIKIGDMGMDSVQIAGKSYQKGDVFTWEEDMEYSISLADDAREVRPYTVIFMKSAHIPAVFMNTQSGSMEYVNAEKGNLESGDICVVLKNGITEYQGALPKIVSRGNASWNRPKKPYTIKLQDKYPLCGLREGDKWRLLALWSEGSRLNSKIGLDMAEALGMANIVQGTWIDLYLNGEYAGIYLLTESVTVGEGRVDIYNLEKENLQYNPNLEEAVHFEEENKKGYLLDHVNTIDGGYLIEKDTDAYYAREQSGFMTDSGFAFSIKEPAHASKEQVEYISGYVEKIDQMIQNGDPAVWDYLDLDSLVSAFLVDEISMDTDMGITSRYFYKDAGDDKLYTGPLWDHENTFGEQNESVMGGMFVDYTFTTVEYTKNFDKILNWYMLLYDRDEFQERMLEKYEDILPWFENLLDTQIDAYAEEIEASVQMDQVKWQDQNIQGESTGHFRDYYANVKYTKFYIAKRLNFLCERWHVPHDKFAVPSNGQMHRITYSVDEDIVGTMDVMDGEELKEPLEYEAPGYRGWIYEYSGENWSPHIPVYEDMILYKTK